MKKILFAIVCLSATATLFAAGTNDLTSEKARVSYAMGVLLDSGWKQQGLDVDPQALAQGIQDVQSGKPIFTPEIARQVFANFRAEFIARMAETNKLEGEAFLAANAKRPGVVTLPDGLQYLVITNGTGRTPTSNDTVLVNYTGTFMNGKVFDHSQPGQPARFYLSKVIPGWAEGITKMKVGSKWQLFIPPDLGYGPDVRPGIPPNSTLIFEVELVSTETPQPPASLTSDIIEVPSAAEMAKGAQIKTIKAADASQYQEQKTNN